MGNKTKKFRVAIVAEFESDLNLTLLASSLTISCLSSEGENRVEKVRLETFELEELDYGKVDLTKI